MNLEDDTEAEFELYRNNRAAREASSLEGINKRQRDARILQAFSWAEDCDDRSGKYFEEKEGKIVENIDAFIRDVIAPAWLEAARVCREDLDLTTIEKIGLPEKPEFRIAAKLFERVLADEKFDLAKELATQISRLDPNHISGGANAFCELFGYLRYHVATQILEVPVAEHEHIWFGPSSKSTPIDPSSTENANTGSNPDSNLSAVETGSDAQQKPHLHSTLPPLIHWSELELLDQQVFTLMWEFQVANPSEPRIIASEMRENLETEFGATYTLYRVKRSCEKMDVLSGKSRVGLGLIEHEPGKRIGYRIIRKPQGFVSLETN